MKRQQNGKNSGIASLDLMLGHTFYNRPCLATGNCYKIMCINKYRLWDHTQKITWFHILLARNTIFPFLLLPGHQPHLANRGSCLEVQAQASNLCLAMFWKTAVSMIHSLVSCPINTYNSFFQFCSRHRRLLCN